jgi:hypothetical protein
MSTKEVVTIFSRALAVYFLAWLLADLTYLPPYLFSLLHHQRVASPIVADTYLRDYDVIWLLSHLFRIVVLFFAVQWFYRSGPAIHKYFLAPAEGDEEVLPK